MNKTEAIDRAVFALERIADALDRAVPPIPIEELAEHKLEERDYKPASNSSSYEQEIFDLIAQQEPEMNAEKEDRIRQFIKEQLDFKSKA